MTALLIIDTETGGLDPKTCPLVEVGAVLFDAVLGVPIESRAFLVHAENNAAESINHIPEAALGLGWARNAGDVDVALAALALAGAAVRGETVLVAHNAAFDRQWVDVPECRWICTKTDVSWPRVPGETGSLVQIALAYDVGVVRAHRALEDCLTLAALLARVHELEDGLGDWIRRGLETKVELIAQVSYARRQLAKDHGFGWVPERKVWRKLVGESAVDGFRDGLPFETRVQPPPT